MPRQPDHADDFPPPEGGAREWLAGCWAQGVTSVWGERLGRLGRLAGPALANIRARDADERAGLRAFVALAALGHGEPELAEELLGHPPGPVSPAVLLFDRAVRLYWASGEIQSEPGVLDQVVRALREAQKLAGATPGQEAATARGYASMILGDALLMLGDVDGARQKLESALAEPLAPPAVLVGSRWLLSGIEHALGREDQALAHLHAAREEAAGLLAEERLTQLLAAGVLLGCDRGAGLRVFHEFAARHPARLGEGTVARLYRLLRHLTGAGPLQLSERAEFRDLLRHLQARHYNASWFLLLTSICGGALRGAKDPCESYLLLVQAAAVLRCRHMDGAARLCDRQIEALRARLGEDQFEAILEDARCRRQVMGEYLARRAEQGPA